MSSLPPVHTTPHKNASQAIADALNNDLVFNNLLNLPSFDTLNRNTSTDTTPQSDWAVKADWTGSGFKGNYSLNSDQLLVTDANSKINISVGDRGGNTDTRASVVVGGNSQITFLNDTVNPSFGYDIVSGEGTNTINLNNGPTLFQSTTGNDLVKSGGGLDTIIGGSGHDTIYAGGQSFVQAGSAGDKIFSSTLTGGHDTIQAGAGSDTITLRAGDNSVIGSTGDTKIQGGTGNDTYDGSSATGNESILGGTGTLTANLSNTGNDTIFGSATGPFVNINLDESAPGAGDSVSTAGGVTTINFAGTGQTIQVQHVKITFNGGTTQTF